MTSVHYSPLTRSDVPAAARLHQVAFPTFFLSMLGQGFLRQFYRAFLEDPSAVTVVARTSSGRLVGTAVGTTEPDGFFGRLVRRRLPQFAAASAAAALRDPRSIPRLLRAVRYRGGTQPVSGGALLSSICVDPAARGTGTGARLLSEWEQAAARAGARGAYLTTDAHGNDGVNAFYTRSGWVVEGEETTPEGRRMNRYVKELERT